MATPLAELIEHVADGDRSRFADLYRRTSGRVFGMANRVVRDRGRAEDVTQEVFLEVWHKAAGFDPDRGSPLSWLLTLAHRRAIDRVRAEQARVDRENRWHAAEVDQWADDVADAVVARVGMHAQLSCLTYRQREALLLAYYGDLSYPESAAYLGVTLSTVKARHRDARTRLAALMAPPARVDDAARPRAADA